MSNLPILSGRVRKDFGYKIIETKPLKEGIEFVLNIPKKKREGAFDRKKIMAHLASEDPKCVCCKIEATNFSLGKDNSGGLHWDLYADNGIALSLDHIHPKSRGGANSLENSQIMCTVCNSLKGVIPEITDAYKYIIDNCNQVYLSVKPTFIRIDYWKKLDLNIYNKISDIFTEILIDDDEDCGELYCYYLKSRDELKANGY